MFAQNVVPFVVPLILPIPSSLSHKSRGISDHQPSVAPRRRLIGYAIDARKQRFLNEKPFVCQPLADTDDTLRWDKEAKDKIKDYNLLDFSI